MELTDILPVEDWEALEKDLRSRFGLCSAVYDPNGKKITTYIEWSNPLCPVIKKEPKGLSQICAVANRSMAAEAAKTGKPVIQECDAGLGRVCVPVISGGELVGSVSGCGMMFEGGELETFLIAKTLEVSEDRVNELGKDLPVLTREKAQETALYIGEFLKKAMA